MGREGGVAQVTCRHVSQFVYLHTLPAEGIVPVLDNVHPDQIVVAACTDGLGADRAAVRVHEVAFALPLELVGSNLNHELNGRKEDGERDQIVTGHLRRCGCGRGFGFSCQTTCQCMLPARRGPWIFLVSTQDVLRKNLSKLILFRWLHHLQVFKGPVSRGGHLSVFGVPLG